MHLQFKWPRWFLLLYEICKCLWLSLKIQNLRVKIIVLLKFKDQTTGENVRGCVSTAAEYSQCMHAAATCKLCIAGQQANCNGVYPENRRKCIRCDSRRNVCPTQQQPELASQYSVVCKNVTDTCVVINRSGAYDFAQMCASDMGDDEKLFCNSGRCSICSSANNCNLKEIDSTTPGTTEATTTESTSTNRPSSGHQFYSNRNLLAIFMIVTVIMT